MALQPFKNVLCAKIGVSFVCINRLYELLSTNTSRSSSSTFSIKRCITNSRSTLQSRCCKETQLNNYTNTELIFAVSVCDRTP